VTLDPSAAPVAASSVGAGGAGGETTYRSHLLPPLPPQIVPFQGAGHSLSAEGGGAGRGGGDSSSSGRGSGSSEEREEQRRRMLAAAERRLR
jgi:hypothetical protein